MVQNVFYWFHSTTIFTILYRFWRINIFSHISLTYRLLRENSFSKLSMMNSWPYVKFFSLRQRCWYCKFESFYSKGFLPSSMIPCAVNSFPSRGNACPECMESITEYFCPVYAIGLIYFLDSNVASLSFPMPFNKSKFDGLIEEWSGDAVSDWSSIRYH